MQPERKKNAPPTKEKKRFSASLRLFLFILLLQLCQITANVTKPIWGGVARAEAITTPFGVLYLTDNPSTWLQDHEQCHLDRLEDIGVIPFYSDYLFGGACVEEVRCGANPTQHFACTDYPGR